MDSALETEVVQRATELLDVSVDVGKLGTALRGLNDHAKSVWESISAHKQQLEWEGTTVSRLKRRKEHLKALKQVFAQFDSMPLHLCLPSTRSHVAPLIYSRDRSVCSAGPYDVLLRSCIAESGQQHTGDTCTHPISADLLRNAAETDRGGSDSSSTVLSARPAGGIGVAQRS